MRKWLHLSLKTKPSANFEEADEDACYPRREVSRRLVLGNICFPITNFTFCLVIGALYWIISAITLSTPAYNLNGWTPTNPFFLISILSLFSVFRAYADPKKVDLKNKLALSHTAGHALLMWGLMKFFPWFNALFMNAYFSFLFFIVEMVFIGGVLGGMVWGIYLIICSYKFGVHHNDAFSAMGRTDYRNFLRLRIKDDELTIYPIGVDRVPKRNGWEVNTQADDNNQDQPVIRPIDTKGGIVPHLIEGPITIKKMDS